ncbi:hypothetical protein SynPROS71_01272 [Synechococcus sp. PROS-7-1]|nr:hypothetical protein SynPROS71_01272 [Synechococcus sp. PROS-7-1]
MLNRIPRKAVISLRESGFFKVFLTNASFTLAPALHIPQLGDKSTRFQPPSSPHGLEADPQVPTHQPVRFVCREDWVQPITHQLNHNRLSKPFDA